MESRHIANRLTAIYNALYKAYGPQHWWPGETPFEVMVGAVLTQNTAWTNVEKAITNLRRAGVLTPRRLSAVPLHRLAALIRPSGYFNIKARRLKEFLSLVMNHYGGSVARMAGDDGDALRARLLEVKGIGPETADSILLYAANKPYFVVDAYTRRILARHGLIGDRASYHDIQRLFMDHLPRRTRMFNEYHALIVRLGKEHCRKGAPLCAGCPLDTFRKKRRASAVGSLARRSMKRMMPRAVQQGACGNAVQDSPVPPICGEKRLKRHNMLK